MPETSGQHFAPRRRTVVRGAAWAAPAVAVAAAAPAFAASPCTTSACPDLSFGAYTNASGPTGNGWSYVQSASSGTWSNNNAVGFQAASTTAPFNGKGVTFAAAAEPSTPNRQLTLSQTGKPALSASCTYTVRVGVITYTSNSTPLVLRVLVGGTSIGSYSTFGESSAGNTDRGIKSFPVPRGTTGAVTFRIEFGAAGDHEDIHLYSPSVTCA